MRSNAPTAPAAAAGHPGWVAALGCFLLYWALGAVGILFAIAPGYASPLFPASGFAVAVQLWSRQRLWPALWLGSFALNASLAWTQGHGGWRSAWVAAGIACGSALQAGLAAGLVQRFLQDRWQRLESERETVLCLLLAGPVACSVSAALGTSVLVGAGVLASGDWAYALLNWWMGDVLGVWIMLPLSLAALYRKDTLWRSRRLLQVLPMAVVLCLLGGVYYAATRWEQAQEQDRVARHGEALAQLLQRRFIAHQEALAALRRLVEVTPQMRFEPFEYFTRITLKDNPDIFALSVNPYVVHAERTQFEAQMQGHAPVAEIRERDAERHLVRAQNRPDYVPVGLIAPLAGNAAAVGYDINSDPLRADAIRRARATASPAITAPIQLVQENRKRPGVLVLHPAFRIQPGTAPGQGPAPLLGFAVGVIKVDEMMDIATRDLAIAGLNVRMEDRQASPAHALLYQRGDPAAQVNVAALWQGLVPVADREWQLSVYATPDFVQHQRHWVSLLVGGGGLMLAALLQVLLMGTTGRTAVVQRTVKLQTRELQAKSADLEDRNAQLDALFTLSPDGFVAIDPAHTIRFVNPAFQAITGISAAEIVGAHESRLDAELQRRAHPSGPRPTPRTVPRGNQPGQSASVLHLRIPRHTVIQIMDIRSDAPGVGRMVYLRDMTAEVEVDQLKSEFLATAAHELRTPMASVYGFAELLMTQALEEPQRLELLGIIHRQAALMADILNELLDLARIEERRGKDFEFEPVTLQALVQDALDAFKPPDGRPAAVTDLPDSPRSVLADRRKAGRALLNVLSNAFKYSPDGGAVQIRCVESPAEAERPQVGVQISDRGIGMTEEQQARIFERFYRADNSGKIPGTGLGMSIVKEIVELHGGSVSVQSTLGQGTTVTLWFPRLPDSP